MKQQYFEELYQDFMQTLDSCNSTNHFLRNKYIKDAPAKYKADLWRECLAMAVSNLEGYSLKEIHGKHPDWFRDELYLCRVFILGRESLLARQGKSRLEKFYYASKSK